MEGVGSVEFFADESEGFTVRVGGELVEDPDEEVVS